RILRPRLAAAPDRRPPAPIRISHRRAAAVPAPAHRPAHAARGEPLRGRAGDLAAAGGGRLPQGTHGSRRPDPAGRHPNVGPPGRGLASNRQQEEARRQLVFWLVARECIKQPKLQRATEVLGERAVEAALRLPEKTAAMVILREWGALELARGNRAAAEKRWTM